MRIILYTLNKEIKKYIFNSDIFFVLDNSCKILQYLTWKQTEHKVLTPELHSIKSYSYLTNQVMWDMKLCCWASSSWHLEGSSSPDGKLYWPSDTTSHSK